MDDRTLHGDHPASPDVNVGGPGPDDTDEAGRTVAREQNVRPQGDRLDPESDRTMISAVESLENEDATDQTFALHENPAGSEYGSDDTVATPPSFDLNSQTYASEIRGASEESSTSETECTLVSQDVGLPGDGGSQAAESALDATMTADGHVLARRDDQTMAITSAAERRAKAAQASATLPDAASRRSPTSRSVTIGRYEVRRVLGQGAFGTVYLAHDPRLDRPVAIKVAKTGVLSGKADVDRFQREARSAAQLRHPHIIPVYEFGESHQSSYIAYEFIKGLTLKGYLEEKKKLSQEEAAALIRKLAAALHYAHEHGIVHRDMKPENILLDDDREPHIADFGLARRDENDVTRTREGLFMGTPAYMSPEQAQGRAHLADGRADVWSLGVMLYEMLTGRRPFDGKLNEVLRAVVEKDPAPVRQVDPALSKDLETICQKCLSKAPEQRYQTGEELAEEIERWQRGEPILARPISVFARTGRWMKRNKAIAGLIGAVCASLLLGFLVSLYFLIVASQASNRARLADAQRAVAELEGVLSAVPDAVPVHLEDLKQNPESIRPRLDELLADAALQPRQKSRTRLALVSLFPDDARVPEAVERLGKDLLVAEPAEIHSTIGLLAPHSRELVPVLWSVAKAPAAKASERLRAGAALAQLSPLDSNWAAIGSDVVLALSAADSWELHDWVKSFAPVRETLRPALEQLFAAGETLNQRRTAGVILARLYADNLERLLPLIPIARPDQLPEFVSVLKDHGASATAAIEPRLTALESQSKSQSDADWETPAVNYAMVLVSLGRGDRVWPLLADNPDKSFRSLFIDSAFSAGVPWPIVSGRLAGESDPYVAAALILTLGNYGDIALPPSSRLTLKPKLLALETESNSPAVHSAAGWTLRQFGFADDAQAAELALRSAEIPKERSWFVDSSGVTFAVVDGPVEFQMGSDPNDPNDPQAAIYVEEERLHRRQIPRSFAIATHEVTVDDFLKFDPDHVYDPQISPDPACPMNSVSWIQAAKYCRWLSDQAKLPEEEMVFPPVDEITDDLKFDPERLSRTGYRLPTSAEWEYACRAHARTVRPWYDGQQLTDRYAWFDQNSQNRTWPVGIKKPNDFGLFDIHGNLLEWCYDYNLPYPAADGQGLVIDGADRREGTTHELRGGVFDKDIELLRTPDRDEEDPFVASPQFGLRLVRTIRRPNLSVSNFAAAVRQN